MWKDQNITLWLIQKVISYHHAVLRVSMLCLTNWGGLGAESQESLCRRPCFFSGHQDPREWTGSPWQSVSAWRSSEHDTGMIFWRDPGYFGLTKIEKHFRKKIGFVCKWRIFLKRNSVTKLKSGDRGGAKLSHQFPLHPNNWRHFDHNDCSGWCFCVCFFKYFLV